ncbi:14905_t:CDS:2, partial [Gigaspora margarita]
HMPCRPRKGTDFKKKVLGPSVHVSDFLIETIGPLKNDQNKASAIMVLLLGQVKWMIDIFEWMHPG